MKIAIISDIHSNCYALEAVLEDIKLNNIKQLIILGDIFGYYPWATKTYQLLLPYLDNSLVIKGNHDELLLQKEIPNPIPSYWFAAKQNEQQLLDTFPKAIDWLKELNFYKKTTVENYKVEMYHGTPENPEIGRYYPTDIKTDFSWYPKENTILFLGHSHYPMIYQNTKNAFIINPGSVGQPRDGNPMPSWVIWNVENNNFELKRTNYNNQIPIQELIKMNWDERAIKALNKIQKGNLL